MKKIKTVSRILFSLIILGVVIIVIIFIGLEETVQKKYDTYKELSLENTENSFLSTTYFPKSAYNIIGVYNIDSNRVYCKFSYKSPLSVTNDFSVSFMRQDDSSLILKDFEKGNTPRRPHWFIKNSMIIEEKNEIYLYQKPSPPNHMISHYLIIDRKKELGYCFSLIW